MPIVVQTRRSIDKMAKPVQIKLSTCLLRPWRQGDQQSLIEQADNYNVWRNLRDQFPNPYTKDDANRWIMLASSQQPLTNFAIEVEGRAVGGIGMILRDDIYRGSAEIGYWLGEAFWGRGIMTESVKAFTRWAFETHKLNRIYAGVLEWNRPSMRVLEKAGYRLEARLEKAVIKEDRVMDEFLYAITRP